MLAGGKELSFLPLPHPASLPKERENYRQPVGKKRAVKISTSDTLLFFLLGIRPG